MNIILPVIAAALVLGLSVRRMSAVHWLLLSGWIAAFIVIYYLRN